MLGSDKRLRHNRDFIRVFKQGKRHSMGGVLLSYKKNGLSATRFGFVISKKYSLLAVRRNKQRRLFQAVIRTLYPNLDSGYDVVVSYTNYQKVLPYKESFIILQKLLKDTHISSN